MKGNAWVNLQGNNKNEVHLKNNGQWEIIARVES